MVEVHEERMIGLAAVRTRFTFLGVNELACFEIALLPNFSMATSAPVVKLLVFLSCLLSPLFRCGGKVSSSFFAASRAYHPACPIFANLACSLYGLSAFAGCLGIVSLKYIPGEFHRYSEIYTHRLKFSVSLVNQIRDTLGEVLQFHRLYGGFL